VHRRFAALHRTEGWTGDAEGFGAGAAILLGDLLLAWSHELFRTSGFDPVTVDRAAPLFDACTTEVVAGQYLDLVSQAMGRSDEDLALRVVRFKSASYTVVRPLHIGAALAGADETLLAALTAYGEPLGIAFQLRDDILGVFGDPEQTGKPAGDDLREGKRTVLLARATQSADVAGRALLDRCVGNPDLTADDLTGLRHVIVDSGALAGVETTITELESRAHAALDAVCAGRDDSARSVLEALTSAALRRTR
jgi:geranylgeranyl diphosphate synthase type I